MPQAVTHFLVPVLLLEIFRAAFVKNKSKFPAHYMFIGGLAGLIPDLDVALYYVLSFFGFTIQEIHRTFTHTLFLPLIFFILGLIFFKTKNKELGEHHLKLGTIFFVITFGICIHLILDATVSGVIMPLYPLSTQRVGIGLMDVFPLAWRNTILPCLDALLLIVWMIYLEKKHKISNFI